MARGKEKCWTLVLVPHSGKSQVLRLRFPHWLGYSLAATALVGAGIAAFMVRSYYSASQEMEALKPLKTVNQQQAEKILELQAKAAALNQQAEQVQALDEQVRQMVGLKEQTGGVGGGQAAPAQTGPRHEAARGGSRGSQGQVALGDVDMDLQSAEERLQAGVEQLHQLKKDVEAELRRKAAYPDYWPVRGSVNSSFGWRSNPFTGKGREFHDGLDLDAQMGDPVRAAGSGKVVFSGWRPGYGWFITIDHGNGYRTSYAHNSKLLAKVGKTVQKGEVVSRVGSTGRSTGPHMHFMVEKNGKLINPRDVLD